MSITDDWYSWIYQFSVNISLYSFTTFLPSIISGLGYHNVKANLMTVPIYFWGMFWCLFIAWASDRTGLRGPFIAAHLLVLIIGYSILVSVKSLGVRYFGCFGKSSSVSSFGTLRGLALTVCSKSSPRPFMPIPVPP